MNDRGSGSGLLLAAMLIVALIIAYLAATQMGGLGYGKKDAAQAGQQSPVRQAQDAVDQINAQQLDAINDLNEGP